MAKQNNRFEELISKLHGAMEDRITRVATGLRNEQAPGTRKVPADEQLEQYLPMRQDPNAWGAIVQQHGIKGALKYYRTMEGIARRKFESLRKDMGLGDDVKFKDLPIPQPILDALMQAAQQATGGEGAVPNAPTPPEPDPASGGGAPVPPIPTPDVPPGGPAPGGYGGPPDAGLGF